MSGDVTVRIPAGGGYAVNAHTASGAVVIDGTSMTGPPGKRGGQLVDGDQALVVKANSVSGNVVVLRAQGDPGHRPAPAERGLTMAVFAHGQLRLYLLALLDEGPRHGYEIIRALEERFNGLYSPSAGTVYPRLAKLEEEGLVERVRRGPQGDVLITERGRAEVRARAMDLADLQQDLDHSVRELANEVRQRVHGSAAEPARGAARGRQAGTGDRHAGRRRRRTSSGPRWLRLGAGVRRPGRRGQRLPSRRPRRRTPRADRRRDAQGDPRHPARHREEDPPCP